MCKFVVLIIACAFLSTPSGFAQQPSVKATQEQIRAERLAFIVEQAGLSPDEKKVFSPIFQQYQEKLSSIRQQNRSVKKPDDMSEGELETQLNASFEREGRILEVKKEYFVIFKTLLPIRKLAKVYKAEREFREDLLIKLQQKK